jgi:hypothetical protein
MKHLLVGIMLKMMSNPSTCSLHQDASPKTLPSLQKILSFEPRTKMTIIVFNYIYNNHYVMAKDINKPHGIMALQV